MWLRTTPRRSLSSNAEFTCVRLADTLHGDWCLDAPKCRSLIMPVPIDELWKERVAASSALGKAGETLRSRQIDLKEVTSAAKTGAWMKAVEKLRSKQAALAEEAAIASRPKLAEPLQEPAAPSEP